MMMGTSRVLLCGLSLALVTISLTGIAEPTTRKMLSTMKGNTIVVGAGGRHEPQPYSTKDIALTAPHLKIFHPRLLVFNGTNFEVFNIDHKDTPYMEKDWNCGRCGKMIPLLVHALKALNSTRFEPGQPVFQMLFSDGDSISSNCVNRGMCLVEDFAPIVLFGSIPMDESEIPTMKGFPNWFYLKCLYEYKINGEENCRWAEPVDEKLPWEELKPTIIWRGSDFPFLPDHTQFQVKREAGDVDLTASIEITKEETTKRLLDHWNHLNPRWRAAALTAEAALKGDTWIDTKFTGPFGVEVQQRFADRGVHVSSLETMKPVDMAKYKYQIDFGGGGGTSWRGTMTKLGFPGVLFHHETPSKDWFFDEMKPWVHYIPVAWHLSGLHEKYLWAETHQEEAKKIAGRATELFETLMEAPYMERVYKELFVDYLGKILEAHITSPDTWSDIKSQYEKDGFEMRLVSHCDDAKCHTLYLKGGADSQRYGSVATA